jgi:diguanylate cyclase (GGDEF)-like protein
MRVTTVTTPNGFTSASHRTRDVLLISGLLVAIAFVDHASGDLPFQHLYYVPIILAAMKFGRPGGLTTALISIFFYHVANPRLMHLNLNQGDIVQMILFLTIGLVAAKLKDDSKRMEQLASTDDLTGLHNLRSFEKHLERLITEAQMAHSPLTLLVLDLDRLKSINDRFGHLAGAAAIRTVGNLIAVKLPPGGVGCRYGGDEFVIALPNHSSEDGAHFAEMLCAAVRDLEPTLAGLTFPTSTLSISVGVAACTFEPGAAVQLGERLFHMADQALYTAKEQGRDSVKVFREELCDSPKL